MLHSRRRRRQPAQQLVPPVRKRQHSAQIQRHSLHAVCTRHLCCGQGPHRLPWLCCGRILRGGWGKQHDSWSIEASQTSAARNASATGGPNAAFHFTCIHSVTGTSVFEFCDRGTWSDVVGLNSSKGCQGCIAGKYQPINGASSSDWCQECPAVTASDALGAVSCPGCRVGTFQDGSGATACVACVPGSYCILGSSVPLPCVSGSHSKATDLSSANQCTPADAGFFAPTGSTDQIPCQPGTSAQKQKMGACNLCEAGKYQDELGSTACKICTEHSWCASGSSSPTACGTGKVGRGLGLASDDQCDPCVCALRVESLSP